MPEREREMGNCVRAAAASVYQIWMLEPQLELVPSWDCRVMGTMFLPRSFFSASWHQFKLSGVLTRARRLVFVLWILKEVRENWTRCLFKSCELIDVRRSAVLLRRGFLSQRSTSCWDTCWRCETTSPVSLPCLSGKSSCTAPGPASMSDVCWAETHTLRASMLRPHKLWNIL